MSPVLKRAEHLSAQSGFPKNVQNMQKWQSCWWALVMCKHLTQLIAETKHPIGGGGGGWKRLFQEGILGAFKATFESPAVCCVLLCQHKGSCSQFESGLSLDRSLRHRDRQTAEEIYWTKLYVFTLLKALTNPVPLLWFWLLKKTLNQCSLLTSDLSSQRMLFIDCNNLIGGNMLAMMHNPDWSIWSRSSRQELTDHCTPPPPRCLIFTTRWKPWSRNFFSFLFLIYLSFWSCFIWGWWEGCIRLQHSPPFKN